MSIARGSLGVLLAIVSQSAVSGSLEVGIGATWFNTHDTGTWYQREFEHDLDLRSAALSVGWNAGTYRIGYQYLGRYAADALVIPVDAEYDRYRVSGLQTMPLTYIRGSGEIHGLYAMRQTAGRVFVEYGLYLYRPTWRLEVFDRRPCFDCAPHKTFAIEHGKRWIATPVIGVGMHVGQRRVAINIRRPNTSGDAVPSVANRWAANVELRGNF